MGWQRLASVTASTKRSPAMVGGKRGDPVVKIASLRCTPLDPVSAELSLRPGTNAPVEVLQTYVHGDLDIREGDILVVDEREYQIRACEEWQWRRSAFRRLIVEEVKT